MNTTVHGESKRGFTLSEVLLAVAIIAFGLVAVFSVLPFGLRAQKDNREETIIRYEAEYWFAVLQAGGLPLESMDRVETVELTDANGTVYTINRYDLTPTNPNNPANVALADAAQAGWSIDVCGWLSAPDFVWSDDQPPQQIPRVPAKFARVWALNGSLFDRLYSHRGSGGHYLEGGEFSFSYFLQTKIEPVAGSGCRITITFHWPISEPIENALKAGQDMASIVGNNELRPASRKAFSILTNLRPKPALTYVNLDAQQKRFLHTVLPGDELSVEELKAMFPPRHSYSLWDGHRRDLIIEDGGMATVRVDVGAQNPEYLTWRQLEQNLDPRRHLLSEAFSENDLGWYVNIYDSEGPKSYQITEVFYYARDNKYVKGHEITLDLGVNTPKENGPFPYYVTFLDRNSPWPTWEDLLSDYQRFGLVEKRGEKYRIGAIYNSWAKQEMTNPAGQIFSVTLDAQDYWPAAAPKPPQSTECSFWFLK